MSDALLGVSTATPAAVTRSTRTYRRRQCARFVLLAIAAVLALVQVFRTIYGHLPFAGGDEAWHRWNMIVVFLLVGASLAVRPRKPSET